MHTTIAEGIAENLGDGAVVRTTTLDEPEHGLTEEVLADTDVLVWWGHAAHGEVADEVVERVHQHVLSGHGPGRAALRALVEDLRQADGHDLHAALAQRAGPRAGLDGRTRRTRSPRACRTRSIIDAQEMYGEFFDIPAPDELVFISLLHRRRGVPLRLHVPPRPRQDLLLLARRPGLPGLPPQGRPPGDRERRRLGRHRPAGAGAPGAAALRDRRLLQRPRLHGPDRGARRCRTQCGEPLRLVLVGAGGMGRAWLAHDRRLARRRCWSAWSTSTWPLARAGRRRSTGRRTCRSAPTPSTWPGRAAPTRVIDVTVPEAHHPVTTAALAAPASRCSARSRWPRPCAQAPVDGRGRRGHRRAVDGLPVPALLPQLAALEGWLAGSARSGRSCTAFFKAPHFGGFREQMAYPLLVDMAIHQFDLAAGPDRRRAGVGLLRVVQPGLELVRGGRRRRRGVRVRRRHPVRLHRAAGAARASRPPGTAAGGSAASSGTAVWDGDHEPVLAPRSTPTGTGRLAGLRDRRARRCSSRRSGPGSRRPARCTRT